VTSGGVGRTRVPQSHTVDDVPEARRLVSHEVAELLGYSVVAFRKLRSRGDFPEPDGWIDGRTPYWNKRTVRVWRKPERKTGRPPKNSDS
jgi:hypothetical protein